MGSHQVMMAHLQGRNIRGVSDKCCKENQNTYIDFMYNKLFFFDNPAVYVIMWKNVVQQGRQQMLLWRERSACWIRKATNTHTLGMCNIVEQARQHMLLWRKRIACWIRKATNTHTRNV